MTFCLYFCGPLPPPWRIQWGFEYLNTGQMDTILFSFVLVWYSNGWSNTCHGQDAKCRLCSFRGLYVFVELIGVK